MLTTAPSDVMRLVSTLVRRIDAELVESAARNAEAGVRADDERRLEAMATLSDLNALDGLTGDVERLPVPRSSDLVTA